MGSDVYGLPSQETYLDSQNFHLDAAKIQILFLFSKYFSFFFFVESFFLRIFAVGVGRTRSGRRSVMLQTCE